MNQPALTSDDVIDALVDAMSQPGARAVDEQVLKQALQGLVRLAQAEQLLRMQLDFDHATDPLGQHARGLARER